MAWSVVSDALETAAQQETSPGLEASPRLLALLQNKWEGEGESRIQKAERGRERGPRTRPEQREATGQKALEGGAAARQEGGSAGPPPQQWEPQGLCVQPSH